MDYGKSIRYAFSYGEFDINTLLLQGNWYHWAFTFDYATRTRCIYINGSLIAMNQAAFPFTGGTALRLTPVNVTFDDFRLYNRARIAADVASLASFPTVPKPVILSQPSATVNVTGGQALSLTVQAIGADQLTYQWFKNGVSTGGAKSASYAITSAQLADSGDYIVVVTNYAGSATSSIAKVA